MQAYATAFSFLGQNLKSVPEQEQLQEIAYGQMMDDWILQPRNSIAQKGLRLMQDCLEKGEDTEVLFEKIGKDFFNLFEMSPARCHMYESLWLSEDKLLYEEQTFQVRACYAKYGLQAVDSHRGPDDHLGIEISFISYLQNLYVQAENDALKTEIQRDIVSFIQDHLMLWGPACLTKMAQEAETDFYKGLALLTHGSLLDFAEDMSIKLVAESTDT